jgi:two-component system LytT family response regulator
VDTPARPIRALIVDDEPLARRGLRQLLVAHRDVVVAGECGNGREALAALEALAPDLLFLDVQMPELDGFGVMRAAIAARGAARMPVTIFLTAYDEFALDAFEVEALDYLVKPVSDERFEAAMRRARRRLAAPRVPAAAERAEPVAPAAAERHLVIPTARGRLVVPLDDVDWIGAEDYYVAVYTGGRRHLLRESMASLEARLDPARFVRVHRVAIVNVDRVRQVRTADGETTLTLRDGTRLPVSRRRRAALARALG